MESTRIITTHDGRTYTADDIEDQIYEAEVDLEVDMDYSGRAMYGARCLGLIGTHADVVEFLRYLAYQAGIADGKGYGDSVESDLHTLFDCRSRTDNMGRSFVWYWPDIETTLDDEATV